MRAAVTLVATLAILTVAAAQGLFSHLAEAEALTLDQIIGTPVVTPEGRRVGRIDDLLYEAATGKVVEVEINAQRFPVHALVSSDKPGEVVLDRPAAASGGSSALLPGVATPAFSRASRAPGKVRVSLPEGRVLLEK